EVSLAHKGVLFLDELPEFSRAVLEALRQPLEAGMITVARANHHVTYPARFQLIAAMNPCRCGYMDNPLLACAKAPRCGRDYQGRISGPMLDRIDLHIEVPALAPQEMTQPSAGEPRAVIAARVAAARDIQAERLADLEKTGIRTNAEAEGELLDKIAEVDEKGRELLLRATERLHLTARGYHRVLRVARTIADLDGADRISRSHVGEAISFRRVGVAQKS
ncbi:MAG: ATP-binding protein, partial [Geminicoccaceae bacterium]